MSRRLAAIVIADVAGYSRLMSLDEEATHAQLSALSEQVIRPAIARRDGRIVKNTGDGFVAEFPSIVDAVRASVAIQERISEVTADQPASQRLLFRMGINIGDVIVEDDDIFGDDVNVAARLQSIADVGGICISRQVLDQVGHKLDIAVRELGPQQVKNIARPIDAMAIILGGKTPRADPATMKQEIRYCRASDGARIAFARVGAGPPLVRAAAWMSHLEHEWESPIWRHVLHRLARRHTLIRYDGRGTGLSDWEVAEISFDAWVNDLEAVVDAAGLERFALLGMSLGAGVLIAYAVRHPERVSHLILYGSGSVQGAYARDISAAEREKVQAFATLLRTSWGGEDPAFRQIFTSRFIPGGTKEQYDWYNDLQRRTGTPDCAYRYLQAMLRVDTTALLTKVTTPTLIMHAREDMIASIEESRILAREIPGARLVVLQGQNHLFLEHEPASERFFEELGLFLAAAPEARNPR
jgi:class 3 adenylate cyclase/pimeloyl-ACP methyl ester carboxylesterase